MASIANRRSVMVLYSDSISPASHCVRLVLAEKILMLKLIMSKMEKDQKR